MNDLADFVRRSFKAAARFIRKVLVGAGLLARYPYDDHVKCGRIGLSIARNVPFVDDGALVFDFQPTTPPSCDCTQFGWIQHRRNPHGGRWLYDNFTVSGPGGKQGAPSDPVKAIQPVQPDNPWYGGSPPVANPPADFGEDPTPQPKIWDKPTHPNVEFVTQLVCATSGEVLFSWKWGPLKAGDLPADVDGEAIDPPY